MSLLIRYIVKGLGWELGSAAAKEAVAKLRQDAEPPADPKQQARDKAERERAEAKRAAAAAKAAEKERKRRENEVDRELAELKKRVRKNDG